MHALRGRQRPNDPSTPQPVPYRLRGPIKYKLTEHRHITVNTTRGAPCGVTRLQGKPGHVPIRVCLNHTCVPEVTHV